MSGQPASAAPKLRVDPVRCTGVGMCAHVESGLVRLDKWGYPVLAKPDREADPRRLAAVVAACPRRALFLA